MSKYATLLECFEEHRDLERAKSMKAYMKDQFEFFGIPSPLRKKLSKDIINAEKKKKNIDWEFIDACYEDKHRECHYVAIDVLLAMHKILVYEDIDRMMPLIKTQQWWDTIDALDAVIGHIGRKDERVKSLMIQWSMDSDFWVRRIAIDFQLAYKDNTDTSVLAQVILNNLGSQEFFINKAIGWSLREYSKTNPEWVREFIERHKESMHSLSIREASKYL